jgi:hypothetical protein
MAATPLTASTRYFARGVTKIYVCTTVVTLSAPSRAEMNAGTDLSGEVAAIAGWQVTGGEIETPDLGTVFTSKIPGATSIGDSSITCYADQAQVDVRGVLPRGTVTTVLILYGGDVPGRKMDGFRTRVRSVGKPVSVGDDAGLVEVQFSITSTPSENITIPA